MTRLRLLTHILIPVVALVDMAIWWFHDHHTDWTIYVWPFAAIAFVIISVWCYETIRKWESTTGKWQECAEEWEKSAKLYEERMAEIVGTRYRVDMLIFADGRWTINPICDMDLNSVQLTTEYGGGKWVDRVLLAPNKVLEVGFWIPGKGEDGQANSGDSDCPGDLVGNTETDP